MECSLSCHKCVFAHSVRFKRLTCACSRICNCLYSLYVLCRQGGTFTFKNYFENYSAVSCGSFPYRLCLDVQNDLSGRLFRCCIKDNLCCRFAFRQNRKRTCAGRTDSRTERSLKRIKSPFHTKTKTLTAEERSFGLNQSIFSNCRRLSEFPTEILFSTAPNIQTVLWNIRITKVICITAFLQFLFQRV